VPVLQFKTLEREKKIGLSISKGNKGGILLLSHTTAIRSDSVEPPKARTNLRSCIRWKTWGKGGTEGKGLRHLRSQGAGPDKGLNSGGGVGGVENGLKNAAYCGSDRSENRPKGKGANRILKRKGKKIWKGKKTTWIANKGSFKRSNGKESSRPGQVRWYG